MQQTYEMFTDLHIHCNSKANNGSEAPTTSGAFMVEMWNLHCLADLDVILWSDPLENFCFIPF